MNFFAIIPPLERYYHWLHGMWPAGTVERLPEVRPDGTTALPGVRVVGDLTGIPLLKFALDSGARAVQGIAAENDFKPSSNPDDPVLDLAIIGGGVAGMAAALEAKKSGLNFRVFESATAFSTIANFPKAKPIFTYPTDLTPNGDLQVAATVKEDLLAELQAQAGDIAITSVRIDHLSRANGQILLHPDGDQPAIPARRVIIAIGRSGDARRLGCPGEDLPKVSNRLIDPTMFPGQNVLVVGGGDSALEAAAALAQNGAQVTLSYRKAELARAKPENIEAARIADWKLASTVKNIREQDVTLQHADGRMETLPNDAVFTLIGRDAPLAFFRRSDLPIHGEWRPQTWASFLTFFVFSFFLYHWKSGSSDIYKYFKAHHWFPFGLTTWAQSLGGAWNDPAHLLGTLALSLQSPSFYYTLAYCVCVTLFGFERIRKKRTPYVRLQTLTLMAVQVIPLFLLPFLLLPWAGHNGWFDSGVLKSFANEFFPISSSPQGREYWRASGFILAWPLFIWNVFTTKPMIGWLIVSLIQTFVIIPFIVRRWGKGAYCGWICSCGALAETLGDAHRNKMPHGPIWNRVNLVGQAALVVALLLFTLRVVTWTFPDTAWIKPVLVGYNAILSSGMILGVPFNYSYIVDLWLAGIVGVGAYFWFSGRVWCRFACPLAALMHIYARFSQFRIFADKKKCISCNVCTSVCHQGIDVMAFANKGRAMQDPECVRCSACVQQCPTGVLKFGRLTSQGEALYDTLPASLVQMIETRRK
jgi:thioredoxin reductase/polyferredoxin